LGNRGYLAHFLDTKALIYLDTERFDAALEVINQAIEIFRQGEDAAGLTDALWTQTRCLLRLERKQDALIVFNELLDIARTRIGQSAVQKFARSLSDEIYALRHIPLTEEVQRFKKERVRAALVQAKGKISAAAKHLGLKNHQALSDILNNQFPGLYEDAGFRRRAVRKAKQQKRGKTKTVIVNLENILSEAEISPLALPDKNFSFDFPCPAGAFKTFYFDCSTMKNFGIESGAIVAVVPVAEIKAGMFLLISEEESFKLARAEYDSWSRVFFIMDERGEPLPLNTEQVVGEPVGYCLIKYIDNKFIEFSRLLL
jgi:tetratricopeptide (TPR) repeat protein